MDYSPINHGVSTWGLIFHGGHVDGGILDLPNPLFIINMELNTPNEVFITDHVKGPVQGVHSVYINDSPDACLPDGVLIAQAAANIALLAAGMNLYIHCAAGVSRSTYMDCATLMLGKKISYDAALALIRTTRPQVQPNSGFEAQLRRLEPRMLGSA